MQAKASSGALNVTNPILTAATKKDTEFFANTVYFDWTWD
jgi:hypothetical protein